MLLAQISDTHIKMPGALAYGRVDTATCLARCVDALNALDPRPDLVLMTGDLADSGRREEYEHLRALLAPLRIPYRLLVGNHDAREPLREAFHDHPELHGEGEFIQYAFDAGPLRIIALDTLDPGASGGRLCDARLDWLARQLDRAGARPVIIALHHPPFDCGIRYLDRVRLAPAESARLAALLTRYPNVERVLCGHVHRPIAVRFGGTLAWCAASTAHQSTLDLRETSPEAFVLEPPGYSLHLYTQAAGLVTHHAYVEPGAGPFPYRD